MGGPAFDRSERAELEQPPRKRTEGQRDLDRILYTTAFRRLDAVSQVVLPEEGHLFHNRLTHSLKVAQIGRRIAEDLQRQSTQNQSVAELVEQRGGLDPDIVEAACLAHDIGHPPFGHVGELALDECARARGSRDGFEGNAQSFRIVVRLAFAKERITGLNLTRATLNAILKYPWAYSDGDQKWGTYDSEREIFDWSRQGVPVDERDKTLEAQIMDWADDITYAVHDLDDFYKAGFIPMRALIRTPVADLEQPLNLVRNKWRKQGQDLDEDMLLVAANGIGLFPAPIQYTGSTSERVQLHNYASTAIGRYVDATTVDEAGLAILPEARLQVDFFQALTRQFVLENRTLTTQRYGQRRIISDLFRIYWRALRDADDSVFPPRHSEEVDAVLAGLPGATEPVRLVTDTIAGMSDEEAVRMHRRLTGVDLGSLTDMPLA